MAELLFKLHQALGGQTEVIAKLTVPAKLLSECKFTVKVVVLLWGMLSGEAKVVAGVKEMLKSGVATQVPEELQLPGLPLIRQDVPELALQLTLPEELQVPVASQVPVVPWVPVQVLAVTLQVPTEPQVLFKVLQEV